MTVAILFVLSARGAAGMTTIPRRGYFVEGHVPAADIRRLLRQRPAARGLAVLGMPTGLPGMEQGGQRKAFETLPVARGGSTTRFASHNPLSRTKG